MKRETREWLRACGDRSRARDILDSDARLRAQVRDLKARLAMSRAATTPVDCDHAVSTGDEQRVLCDDCAMLARALDLRVKNWRKP